MLKIDQLIVMQNAPRYVEGIDEMAAFVKGGGFWTKEALEKWANEYKTFPAPMIAISAFEDGTYYIHDGHHRILATLIGGRDYLRDDEYVETRWSYLSYMTANLEKHFVTPFDPRIEVRLPDFHNFKGNVLDVAKTNVPGALKLIADKKLRYCEPRKIKTVQELLAIYERRKTALSKARIKPRGRPLVARPDTDEDQKRRNELALDRAIAAHAEATGQQLDRDKVKNMTEFWKFAHDNWGVKPEDEMAEKGVTVQVHNALEPRPSETTDGGTGRVGEAGGGEPPKADGGTGTEGK